MSNRSHLAFATLGLALFTIPVLSTAASAQNRAGSPAPFVDETVQIGQGDANSCDVTFEQTLRAGQLVWRRVVMCQDNEAD